MRAQGSRKVIRTSVAIAIGFLTVAISYCVVLLSTYSWIVPATLRDRYSDLLSITLLWCGYACVIAIRNGQELSIQVLRRFRQQTMANSVSAVASLTAVYVLMVSYGPSGALVGMIIGELVLMASLLLGTFEHVPKFADDALVL
jgi:O-antigen/teichoic acid export membrane protein